MNDLAASPTPPARDTCPTPDAATLPLPRSDLFPILAHELRNALAPLHTAAAVLKTPGASGSDVARAARIIDRQVQSMARLITDLLDIASGDRGTLELQRQRVAPREFIDAAVEAARPTLAARGHQLVVDIAPRLPEVDVDVARMVQVLANLLGNAAKFTESGGHVSVVGYRSADAVVVQVIDDGIGIAADALDRIFDMYVRGAPSGGGGLGVGLALARRIVVQHGGRIDAASAGPGYGSTFTIRLPLPRADGNGAAAP